MTNRKPVGVASNGQSIFVVCDDGSVFASPNPATRGGEWQEQKPVPGTVAAEPAPSVSRGGDTVSL